MEKLQRPKHNSPATREQPNHPVGRIIKSNYSLLAFQELILGYYSEFKIGQQTKCQGMTIKNM